MTTNQRSCRAWLCTILAAAGISAASAHDRVPLDTNGDSVVDLPELQAGDPAATPELFSSIDVDGNGLLSHEELRGGRMTLRFARLDQNGDSGVSLDEMRVRFARLTQERFQRLDADGNGLLSKEEMTAMHGRSHRKTRMYSAPSDKDATADSEDKPQQ